MWVLEFPECEQTFDRDSFPRSDHQETDSPVRLFLLQHHIFGAVAFTGHYEFARLPIESTSFRSRSDKRFLLQSKNTQR